MSQQGNNLHPIKLVFHPIYSQLDLPRNHRFPILKYQTLHDTALFHYSQLVDIERVNEPVSTAMLKQVHDIDYIKQFIAGTIDDKRMKRIGFPWSEQFVKRTRTAVAGTIKTAELAFEHGVAINLTGGYHHAHPGFGSGFCVFNDLVLAAKNLITQGKAQRVLIFDCDVHQGDGTATSAATDHNIFSCSIHCEKNFPSRKQQSDWDIGLAKNLTDKSYLEKVNNTLFAAIHSFRPDFIIYDAGVDIHEDDDLGLLNISTQGIYDRDLMVFNTAKQHQIPIAAVIGGGYQRDIDALTQVHMQLIHAAVSVYKN